MPNQRVSCDEASIIGRKVVMGGLVYYCCYWYYKIMVSVWNTLYVKLMFRFPSVLRFFVRSWSLVKVLRRYIVVDEVWLYSLLQMETRPTRAKPFPISSKPFPISSKPFPISSCISIWVTDLFCLVVYWCCLQTDNGKLLIKHAQTARTAAGERCCRGRCHERKHQSQGCPAGVAKKEAFSGRRSRHYRRVRRAGVGRTREGRGAMAWREGAWVGGYQRGVRGHEVNRMTCPSIASVIFSTS